MKKSLIIVAIMVLLVGCTKNKEESKEKKENVEGKNQIVYAMTDESQGLLHPLLNVNLVDGNFSGLLFPSLLQFSNDNELEPYFAKEWEVSEDGKTFIYRLNENAVWSDGEKVTAEDVIFTFTSIADPKFTGTGSKDLDKVEGVEEFREGKSETISGLEMVDEYTVKVVFAEEYAPGYAKISTFGICPKHIWSEIPIEEWEDQTKLLNVPVSFGAYEVEKYEQAQVIEMKASKEYFGGQPKVEKIIFKQVNPDTIMTEFKNKEIDIAPVKTIRQLDIDTMKKELGLKEVKFPDRNYRYISFNMRKPVFQDIELRKAMASAIDRETIVDKIMEGRATIVNSPYFIKGMGYTDDLNIQSYNLENAKKILDAAGYKDSDGDGIRETKDGEKLAFTFKYQSKMPAVEQMSLGIQQNFKEIGIELELVMLEYDKVMDENIYQHDFDLYTHTCIVRPDPEVTTWWHSESSIDEKGIASWNFGGYKNPKVDKLLNAADGTVNSEKRQELCYEIAQILNDDAPMVFLFAQDNEILYSSNVTNYEPSTFNVFYNSHLWEIKQ